MIENSSEAGRGLSSRFINLPRRERPLLAGNLMPRLQELLYLAKSFKEQGSYKYCWDKDTAVFLRKSDSSRAIRLNTVQDIEQLRHSEAGGAASNQTASDSAQS